MYSITTGTPKIAVPFDQNPLPGTSGTQKTVTSTFLTWIANQGISLSYLKKDRSTITGIIPVFSAWIPWKSWNKCPCCMPKETFCINHHAEHLCPAPGLSRWKLCRNSKPLAPPVASIAIYLKLPGRNHFPTFPHYHGPKTPRKNIAAHLWVTHGTWKPRGSS